MKVKSIAKCSLLQYFWPTLSNYWSWKYIFGLFEIDDFIYVLLLLISCWLLFPLWESVIVLCFGVRSFVSILVLQSSRWRRESWLLCFVCLPCVSWSWWLLCASSSRLQFVIFPDHTQLLFFLPCWYFGTYHIDYSLNQSELHRPIPWNSPESDHGCTSRIYFDNVSDNVTLTLYNVTLTSQKP